MSKRKENSPKKTQKSRKSLYHIIQLYFEKNADRIITHKELCKDLDIKENELRKQSYFVLKSLVDEAFLKEVEHAVFKYNGLNESLEGEIQISQKGSGFLLTEDKNDVFISSKHTGNALNGDYVRVTLTKNSGGRREGKVSAVLRRERTQFVGSIQLNKNVAFFVPDNKRNGVDIFIPKEKLKGALNKSRAIVKITAWPKSSESPFGEVIEVLDNQATIDVETLSILLNQGIEYEFPQEVIDQAERVTMDLDPEEIKKRKDFRDTLTFTIDPIDAKDFDDALSIKYLEDGKLEIGIHIADVSHYVTPDSPMDKEAAKRANSVYLVDRVVPMLPEQISNLACSLRPNEDKFSFSAVFVMDENGKIYEEWYGKTVIHSNRRFTYEQAQEVIEGKEDALRKEILMMDKIAKIYRAKRMKSGALNIESEEVYFKLDENKKPVSVFTKVSKDAHKLVEEFMLLANKKVAIFLAKPKTKEAGKIPTLYRVHDKPDAAKIETFRTFIDKFGYEINYTHADQISGAINKLLTDIRYTNEYRLISSMAIRSMAKASYETTNIGHYGLAFDYYTHFTSPIRRYADLMVHRILFEELNHRPHTFGPSLNDICKRISRMERRAIEAERESNKYFQTLFLEDKVGEAFEGTVSGIADHGVFVKLDDNNCEGLVPMQELPGDHFSFDKDKYSIIGFRTGKEYNFGDKVKVRVLAVNSAKRQIDLEIAE